MPPSSDTHAGGAVADTRSALLGRSPNSYVEILVSSVLIGGSSVLALVVGLVRTKAMAVLLGPAGFGLFAMFLAIADLARSVAGMGLSSSGVRQIAAAAAEDDRRVALTAAVLRRTAWVLGVLGAGLLAAAAVPVAEASFGSRERVTGVAIVALAVLFRVVAEAEAALLQGLRRIGDLAKINVLGPALGTAASIAIVYRFGEAGVSASVAVAAAAGLAVTLWYARRAPVARVAPARAETTREAAALLKLGFAFLVSGILMMGVAYVVRIIVLRQDGLEAAGLYQAAWTLGGLYVGIVLQAMGTDFYPRLVGSIGNKAASNRLVNEQAQISLLLAGPGVAATLALAPVALWLLYSPEFVAAAELLRWTCLGMALRVITWPVGYVIVARNDRVLFVLTELFWAVLNVGLTFLLVRRFGLEGAGIAFFLSYVAHGIVVYLIVRRLTGFRWSSANLRTGVLYLGVNAMAFSVFLLLPLKLAMALAVAAVLLTSLHALYALTRLVELEQLPAVVQRAAARLSVGRHPLARRT